MIKTSSKQTGSAHVVIIVILVVALLGTLGFVFWQNFIARDGKTEQAAQTSTQKEVSKEVTYKTYQTDTHPISFKYSDKWSLENPMADNQYEQFRRSIDVKTDKGDVVTFSVGGQGIGGTCGGDNISKYSVIEVVPTSLKATKPVVLSYTIASNRDGTYDARYGLVSDSFTTLEDGEACMYYYLFDSGNDTYKLVGFNGIKHFTNLDDAKKFVSSDEYSAIKKMILTLSY